MTSFNEPNEGPVTRTERKIFLVQFVQSPRPRAIQLYVRN
jgi:hypothetical protein